MAKLTSKTPPVRRRKQPKVPPTPNQLTITPKTLFAVGIDADVGKSGLAVYGRRERRMLYVGSLSIDKLLEAIGQLKPGEAVFYIDAGWLNEGYHHYDNLPTDFDSWNEKAKRGYLIQCGVRVGRNFGVGQLLVNYLRAKYGPDSVREVRPATEKWDSATLKQYTGWTKRTNSEGRDAAKLCFQR